MSGGLCDDAEISKGMVEMMPPPTVSNPTVVIGFELPKKLSESYQNKESFKCSCRSNGKLRKWIG